MQAAVGVFLGDTDHQPQVRLDHLLLGDPRFALALLDHVHDAAELGQAHARLRGDVADFEPDALDRVALIEREGGPFLVLAGACAQPVFVQLVADIGVEELAALDLVAFGEAQHLPAQRG